MNLRLSFEGSLFYFYQVSSINNIDFIGQMPAV